MSRLARENAIVGRYRLADFLGAGGMGEVYRATHLETHQVVAIKIFSPSAIEAKWLARFYHEARVHGRLDHPNIVRLIELVDAAGRPCLVMEYVDGESLSDRIARAGRVEPAVALSWIRDLASALSHVHALGIVHRDIKPANVRLTRDQQVKLLDFGIAKSAQAPDLTNAGHVIGTLRYLSPEQLNGTPITHATDIWALGVMLYELVTGQVPFEGATTAELWGRITSGVYTPVSRSITPASERERALLAQVDEVIASCLARHPERRIASAALLADRAGRLVAAGGTARRPSLSLSDVAAPLFEIVDRHRRLFALGAALIALAAFLIALLPGPGSQPPEPPERPPSTASARHRIDVMTGRARVIVNGTFIGETPTDYVGRLGETIDIELQQEGYDPVRERVSITGDGTSTFTMRAQGPTP